MSTFNGLKIDTNAQLLRQNIWIRTNSHMLIHRLGDQISLEFLDRVFLALSPISRTPRAIPLSTATADHEILCDEQEFGASTANRPLAVSCSNHTYVFD